MTHLHCREINDADIDGVVNLLTVGYPRRNHSFWMRAIGRLSARETPAGFPRYGYLLECDGRPVGVILLICSGIVADGEARVRCNTSSWYVEPAFRGYAGMMVARATRRKDATYFNITPDAHTLPILETQGYRSYCQGRFLAIPTFSPRSSPCRVTRVTPDGGAEDLPLAEATLLSTHAGYGCLALTCGSTERQPFVFLPLRKAGIIPFAYLVYCRQVDELVRYARPLGQYLLRRGLPFVVVDASGPINGLAGRYFDGRPKYFRGPAPPSIGDIAYTERVLFSF